MKSQNNQRPPEPKVAGSNLAWRARNSRGNQSRECTGQHENTRRRGAVLTNKRQSGEDTGEQPVASGVDSIRAAAGDVTASDLAESGQAAVSEVPLPEALRGCSDFARGFIEGSRSAAPTPELDRAIICRALIALQAWDEWVYDRAPLDAAFESLRSALVASGYLDAKGVVNG